MNKSCLLSHTPEMCFSTFQHLSWPLKTLAMCSASLLLSSSPDVSPTWIWLSFAHLHPYQVSPVTQWWGGGGDTSPIAAHPPQVSEAMKALRNLLLVGAHPRWNIQSFSSSPESKGSFIFGLPPWAVTVQPASAQQKIKLISFCIFCLWKTPSHACRVAPAFAKCTPSGTNPPFSASLHTATFQFIGLSKWSITGECFCPDSHPYVCTEPSPLSEASWGLVLYLLIVFLFF